MDYFEIEFTEEELNLLNTPELLRLFLHSMNEMNHLVDLTDLETYYVDMEAYEFAQVVSDFQKFIDESED